MSQKKMMSIFNTGYSAMGIVINILASVPKSPSRFPPNQT